MAIPVWPSELPQKFNIDGYSEKLRDGRLLTKTSAGPGKARLRFSAAVIPVAATMRLDYDAKARFERFWNEDTKGGVLAFLLPDQTHDGLPVLSGYEPLLDSAGNPIVMVSEWLAMFGQEAPTLTPWGVEFMASFTLNVMP